MLCLSNGEEIRWEASSGPSKGPTGRRASCWVDNRVLVGSITSWRPSPLNSQVAHTFILTIHVILIHFYCLRMSWVRYLVAEKVWLTICQFLVYTAHNCSCPAVQLTIGTFYLSKCQLKLLCDQMPHSVYILYVNVKIVNVSQ